MTGYVDGTGRAIVRISVRSSVSEEEQRIDAWIDTGFTGDLLVSQRQIDDLEISQSGTVKAVLADGSEVALLTYTCAMEWFGVTRQLEIIANDGNCTLLGVGLLRGHDLHISYRSSQIIID